MDVCKVVHGSAGEIFSVAQKQRSEEMLSKWQERIWNFKLSPSSGQIFCLNHCFQYFGLLLQSTSIFFITALIP